MQKITPFLWFDDAAEEAANFYVSVFDGAEMLSVNRVPPGGRGEPGAVLTVGFRIAGQHFTALNGGPEFRFTEAISFVIHCQSQGEVDRYWDALTMGGEPGPCGWLKDKFGVSWQVVPDALVEMMGDEDGERAARVVRAMMGMSKIDIAALEGAYAGTA
ncbi:MAG: VOC family protein [Thermomicrobiales bacterium]|nr:VOC family protein [Thermomicrobiales bacterium]